jgi:hypothetical protein
MDAPGGTSLRHRLREKLPEILIEAASVVVALLLALALNGWNENRQVRERAATARAAILAEPGENRREINEAQPKRKAIVDSLNAALAKDAPPSHEMQVNLGVSLLSAAAWHAALATDATQTIDFARMTRVAKVYEVQESYLHVQSQAMDQLGSIPADPTLGGPKIAASLVPRLSMLSQLADGLAKSYDDILGPGNP